MEYNYFPGRLRFRDKVLRDEDIRNAALEIVKLICPEAQITYKETTASILALYPAQTVNLPSLKILIPHLLKIEPKIRFYTPKKKEAVLNTLKEIKSAVEKKLVYSN